MVNSHLPTPVQGQLKVVILTAQNGNNK